MPLSFSEANVSQGYGVASDKLVMVFTLRRLPPPISGPLANANKLNASCRP